MANLITNNILNLTPQFWDETGVFIQGYVLDDCRDGVMQDNTEGHSYAPGSYVKYKANRMERFTTRKYKTGYIGNKGTKLKAFSTVPIVSTQTNPVNMILSQRTVNSLHPKASDNNGVTMAFGADKTGILTGNRDRGYDIIGLNDKNREKVRQRIIKEFNNNIKNSGAPSTIIIEVK